MIQKYIFTLAIATVLWGAACGVFAETKGRVPLPPATDASKMSNIKAEVERLRAANKTKITDVKGGLQEKVGAIKDAKRKDTALGIIGQFARANQLSTNHFTDVLNHLDAVLAKVESRAAKAKAQGRDVAQVEAAIQKAKDAIIKARTAVDAQAKKSYQAVIKAQNIQSSQAATPEGQNNLISSMRTQFQAARDTMKTDLFGLRDGAMKDARQAVQDAIKTLPQ